MLIIEIDDPIINDALLTRELLENKDGTRNHEARLALSEMLEHSIGERVTATILKAHDKIRKP